MKYIVKHENTESDYPPMYMIACRSWTPKLLKATVHSENEQAAKLVGQQWSFSDKAWKHVSILKYTDEEYFKAVLKG